VGFMTGTISQGFLKVSPGFLLQIIVRSSFDYLVLVIAM
jgi:hypothetical protein